MKILFLILIASFYLIIVPFALADIGLPQQPKGRGVDITNASAGDNLGFIVRNATITLFSVGGLAFTIMIIWGAVSWILSGGDKEKVAGARKRITTSIIGLVLLSLSFVIIFVVGQITGVASLYSGDFKLPGLLDP